ncbi:hypothetical protein TcBrA4_0051070 [Trypanosoma cruzi]|nr:hypothetical protein TcBrA4_0051070 [Trypanosoma cruzi]
MALKAELVEQQQETERKQRKLEGSSTELKELNAAIPPQRRNTCAAPPNSKEKLALTTLERDRLREDRDRINYELKDVGASTEHSAGTLLRGKESSHYAK